MNVPFLVGRIDHSSLQHVGIRRYQSFLRQIYDLLDDDGIFVLQVAGIRPHWQYEDLIWYHTDLYLAIHDVNDQTGVFL